MTVEQQAIERYILAGVKPSYKAHYPAQLKRAFFYMGLVRIAIGLAILGCFHFMPYLSRFPAQLYHEGFLWTPRVLLVSVLLSPLAYPWAVHDCKRNIKRIDKYEKRFEKLTAKKFGRRFAICFTFSLLTQRLMQSVSLEAREVVLQVIFAFILLCCIQLACTQFYKIRLLALHCPYLQTLDDRRYPPLNPQQQPSNPPPEQPANRESNSPGQHNIPRD